MGIIRGGILGGFRKKAGAVIGSYWGSLDVIKGLPRISNKPATQAQLDQRSKFGMVTGFFSYLGDLIEVGYKALSGVETPMNTAVSYHLRNAVTGVSPNFTMDYPQVMFSQGKVKKGGNAVVSATTVAELDFSWTFSGIDGRFEKGTDRLSILVYNRDKHDFVTIKDIVARSVGAYTLSLPVDFSGDLVHVYIGFTSFFDKLKVSDSQYLGSFTIL